MKLFVALIVGVLIYFIFGWVTGTEEYGGVNTKDDERSQLIKHKAIVSSWLLLLLFFIVNFTFDFFNLNNGRLAQVEFAYPSLFYLLVAVVSYFVYYWIYSLRMSSK